MTISTSYDIKRAIVVAMRANTALKAAAVGGMHEGFAPAKAKYPFITYQIVYDPLVYTWGSLMNVAGLDVKVFAPNMVDANNIDSLIFATLDDAALVIDEQTTLYCRRIAGFSDPDVDEEGNKIYSVGGTYEIWTDQPH